MKKENVLEVVQNSVSSIFTKDDVLKLIESIEQEQQTNQVYDLIKKLQDLQENISYKFQNLCSDEVVDYDSVEFSIGYNNRIEVEDVSLNVDNLTDIVIDSFSCLIDELRELELGSDDINVVDEEVVQENVEENEL
jgi:hypothetical protein